MSKKLKSIAFLLAYVTFFSVPVCFAEEIDVFWLAEKGTPKYFNIALEDGAVFNISDDTGRTPLHNAAVSNRNPESVKFLIEQGINVNAEWKSDVTQTPLSLAVANNNPSAVAELLSHGANPDFINSASMLTQAVKADNPEITALLLNAKANPDIRDLDEKLALDYALELPDDAKLKNSQVFEQLKSLTTEETGHSAGSTQLEKLIAEEKVPLYVRDKGKFIYNNKMKMIKITGDEVLLRSQPNMKANVAGKVNKEMWGAIDYAGEWTHPKGDRWLIGLYDNWDKYPEAKAEKDKKVVWISDKFAEPVTSDEYAEWRNGIDINKAKALAQKDKRTAANKKIAANKNKNNNKMRTANKASQRQGGKKQQIKIWQCVRCGERYIRGLIPEYDAIVDIASLGMNAGGPPHTKCRLPGYHIWQRIK